MARAWIAVAKQQEVGGARIPEASPTWEIVKLHEAVGEESAVNLFGDHEHGRIIEQDVINEAEDAVREKVESLPLGFSVLNDECDNIPGGHCVDLTFGFTTTIAGQSASTNVRVWYGVMLGEPAKVELYRKVNAPPGSRDSMCSYGRDEDMEPPIVWPSGSRTRGWVVDTWQR